MSRMIAWIVETPLIKTEVLAATPESAAKKVLGLMWGYHWESFRSEGDVPEWAFGMAVVSSVRGVFYCAMIEHG